jgi:Family of unknown function (DUF6535)
VSVQDLRPNSQDTSAFYLANIYQLLANPNVSRASILATPAKPPPFSPPKFAIWVNALWFLSLVISLTCALLATLLQQWARRYVTVTQPPRYSPHKRARIRAFFADGVENFHLPWAVETLPTLLHLSLFLFFSGLIVFSLNVHYTIFYVIAWWIGLSAVAYGSITLMPIFRHDSPYYAPLSSSVWFLYTGVPYGVFRILAVFARLGFFGYPTLRRFNKLVTTYRERLLGGIVKSAQENVAKLTKIDGRILKWTFDALDEDHELEQFFEGIPGFCSSKVVCDPRRLRAELSNRTLTAAFGGFLNRTCSSSLLSETVKERRLMVCMQAADALDHSFPSINFLTEAFERGMDGVLRSVQMGHSLRRRCHGNESETALYAQGIIAGIIARVSERDGHWNTLVMDQLGVSEGVLQDYLAHGDSVLLANLIHNTRQFFRFYHERGWVSSRLLLIQRTISKFDIRNTLPGLQHDFCASWNEIALEARNNNSYISSRVLRPIRHLYIALHEGTDAAPTAFSASTDDHDLILFDSSSYPLCNIPSHHTHLHEAVVSSAGEITYLPTITPSARPDVSSSPTLTTDHNRMHLTDEPSPHNVPQATPILRSFHPLPPVNVGNSQFVLTSPVPTIAIATESPANTSSISSVANSESDARLTLTASTLPLQYDADIGVFSLSMMSSIPLSSLPTPVSSDMLHADPQSSFASPVPLPSTSARASPLMQLQESSILHPNVAPNAGTFDTHHNPDVATELSHHSLDEISSSRNIDRP